MFSSRRSYFSTWCNTSGLCLLLTNVVVLGELSPGQRPNCEFKAANYSLEWAFEPISKNVVFVLKAHNSQPNFWTGIGFGRPNEPLDFIGVLAKNGQAAIIDAHVDESGVLAPDTLNNVQSIEVAFDTAHNAVLAKFARPITSTVDSANDRDLTGCVNFNMPLEGGALGTSGVKLRRSEMKVITVCDIEKQCAIEIRGKSPNGDQASKAPLPEVAHSVDLSGTGDPCSFQGAGYTVNWTYNPNDDTVDFVMKHSAKVGRWWSAVGIGEFMADMDIGIVFIEASFSKNGNVKKIADFYSTSYDVPEVDQVQDWTLDGSKTKKSGDSVEIHFSRAIDTKDGRKDKSLDGCVLFQFAANGGRYGDDFDVHKHEDWPDLYKACDLKQHCVNEMIEVDKRANPGPGKKGGRRKPTTTTSSPEVNESNDETTIIPVTEDTIIAVDNATTDAGVPPGAQGAGGQSVETTTWGLGDSSAQNGTEATTSVSATDNLIANSTVLPVDGTSATLNTSDLPVTPTLNLNFNDGTASTVNDQFTTAQPVVPQENPERLLPSADGSLPAASVPGGVSDTWTTVSSVVPPLAGQPAGDALNGALNNPLPVPVKSQEDEINGSGEEPSTVGTGGAEQPTTTQPSASPVPDTSGKIDNASLTADSLTPIRPSSPCDPLKPDLPVCTGYMDNYFTQVKKWADKHNESADGQLGKACKLLNAVPHVPSLCCTIFNDKCGGQF